MLLIKLLFCLAIFTVVLLSDEKNNTNKHVGFKFSKWQILLFKGALNLLLRENDKEKVILMDGYVDFLLPGLNDFIATSNLDPIDIPPINESFSWTIFTGGIFLKNGTLHGVSTFERKGHVVVNYKAPNLNVTIPLGFSNSTFTYNYDVKFMNLGPSGIATGRSQGNKFTVDLSLNTNTLKATLGNFYLETLGSLSLEFSGNGLADWVVNLIMPVIMPVLKPILKIVIKGYVVDGLKTILDVYNTAICEAQDICDK